MGLEIRGPSIRRTMWLGLGLFTGLACSGPLPDLSPTIDRCGDGRISSGEECDDGNLLPDDSCTDGCRPAECGDGILRLDLVAGDVGYEACDDGNNVAEDACTNSCASARCGDGYHRRDLEAGEAGYEACDDGNDNDQDACTHHCAPPRCGDEILHEGEEACDDGNEVETDACRSNCEAARCGDGVIHREVEACDDGNDIAGDACTADCQEARCGDGVLWNLEGGLEECDDGNAIAGDGCAESCQAEICGNGRQDTNEACDDGNDDDFDGCRNHCALAVCGDGVSRTDLEAGVAGFEACDDGNDSQTDSCLSDCSFASCGDGFLLEAGDEAPGEACDDGNLIDEDACTAVCTVARCGDGIRRTDLNEGAEGYEVCDDGNDDPMDGCSIQCRADDHGDSHATATVLTAAGATGAIQSAVDQDYFRWSSPVPGMYRFTITSEEPAEDPVVLFCGLRDEEDRILDQLDAQPRTRLEMTLDANEVIYLLIKPLVEDVDHGRYRIQVQTTCGNGVKEDHESCDPAAPETGSFSCRSDCEWRRSIINGWQNTCYRQRGVPWCTGEGRWGILGPISEDWGIGRWVEGGADIPCMRRPVRVPDFDDGLRSMALGDGVACMTNARSEALCMGLAIRSVLTSVRAAAKVSCIGDPNRLCVERPEPVHGELLTNVTGVAIAGLSIFALQGGTIYSWGASRFGVLGRDEEQQTGSTPTPAAIEMPEGSGQLLYLEGSPVAPLICALTEDVETAARRLYCWGQNHRGQTGLEPRGPETWCPESPGRESTRNCVRSPRVVEGLEDVHDFAVGLDHICALRMNGELRCWGSHSRGQLGAAAPGFCNPDFDEAQGYDNNVWCTHIPQRVDLPPAIDVAAGRQTTCAVLANGRVACWGNGSGNALGLGRVQNEYRPRLLGRINHIREISAGSYHTCARHQDQQISCWGDNRVGQTGSSSLEESVRYPSLVEFR